MDATGPHLHDKACQAPDELSVAQIAGAARRETDACLALMARYERPVYALLWRMLGYRFGKAVVDEICQDTFLRVFRLLETFDPDGSARLSTWILTIATRLALNHIRRESRAMPRSQADIAVVPDGRGDQPDEGIQKKDIAKAVERYVAELPEAQRAVLVLRLYHDMSLVEIATSLDTELGTVKSRLSRARRHLRTKLEAFVP